jgi:hypothetical protein
MGFYENIAEFAGLPILRYPDTVEGHVSAEALAKPGDYAWRLQELRQSQYRDRTDTLADLFASFLDRVDAAAVRAIVFGSWNGADGSDNDELVRLLVGSAARLPNLRSVFLGEILAEENEVSWILQADVSPLLEAYPALEELWIRGGNELRMRPVTHPSLKTLVVETGGLPGEFVRNLDASTLPHLEHLELYLGTDEYGGDATASDLTDILDGSKFPRLTYLGLRNALAANEFAEALADAPVVAQLLTLDLSLGALTDTGADALLQGQPLTHLELLDLHHHYLSDAMMERIEEAFLGTGTEVDVNDQEEADEIDEDGEPEWLSIAHSE